MEKISVTEESLKKLQEEFVNSYDIDYWHYKLNSNLMIWDKADEFADFLEIGPDDTNRNEFVEEITMYAASDLVYSFYHSAETLLAMILASETDFPWIILRNYQSYHLRSISEKIEQEETDFGFFKKRFYPLADENDAHDRVETSIAEIHEFLRGVNREYAEREVYNSFKHGLRLMNKDREIEINNPSDDSNVKLGGYSHVFLEDEKVNDTDVKRLIRVTKAHDPEFYYHMASQCVRLIEHLIEAINRRRTPGKHPVQMYPEGSISEIPFDRADGYVEMREPIDAGECEIHLDL